MANQLETTIDAPAATTDSTAVASKALINEVNSDKNAPKPNDIKSADQTLESKINATFGSLTICGDDSKDATPAAKATGDNTAPKTDAPAADKPATTLSDSPATPAADKPATTLSDSPATPAADKPATTPSDSPATTPAADTKGDANFPGQRGDGTPDVAKVTDDKDIDQDALKKIQDDPKAAKAKNNLENDISKHEKGLKTDSPEYMRLEEMRQNMELFEGRAAAQHPPLGPDEIARTYKSVSHLIDAKDGPNVLPKKDRMQVAAQTMLHAADPTTIDQGNHETCNVTTVETRMFSKNPAAAASLIDQVATTGEYHTPGTPSETVKINPKSLERPLGEEECTPIPLDGDRSYASQIFQVTAIDLSHQTHDYKVTGADGKETVYPKGTVEYKQEKPNENEVPPNPTGETLYDKRTDKPILDAKGSPIHEAGLDDDHIVDSYNAISDHKDSGFYITQKDDISGEGKEVTKVGSEAELKQKIEDAQRDGKLPLIVRVNTTQEPFFTESGGGSAGGAGGAHVVSITGIDSDGKAIMDNQWGKSSKHSIDMHDLYQATMAPGDAINDLKQECAKNAQDGKVDYSKEAELLRLRHSDGDLKGADKEGAYKEQLVWLTKNAAKDAGDNHGGQLDARTETELKSMLKPYEKDGQVKDQVWDGPMTGILDGSGNIGTDNNGTPTKLSSDYATRQMDASAKQLYDAGDATFYFSKDDYQKMDSALAYKSPAQIQQMDQEFKATYGKSMEDYIKDRFKHHPEERDKALQLLHKDQTGNQQAAA